MEDTTWAGGRTERVVAEGLQHLGHPPHTYQDKSGPQGGQVRAAQGRSLSEGALTIASTQHSFSAASGEGHSLSFPAQKWVLHGGEVGEKHRIKEGE